MSKPALWATSTAPWANSRNAGRADSMRGASATIAVVMPVSDWMNGGIGRCGLTRVWNSPSTSPPRTLTAPISVMARVGRAAAGGLEVDDDERDIGQRRAQVVEGALHHLVAGHLHGPDGRPVV